MSIVTVSTISVESTFVVFSFNDDATSLNIRGLHIEEDNTNQAFVVLNNMSNSSRKTLYTVCKKLALHDENFENFFNTCWKKQNFLHPNAVYRLQQSWNIWRQREIASAEPEDENIVSIRKHQPQKSKTTATPATKARQAPTRLKLGQGRNKEKVTIRFKKSRKTQKIVSAD